jgi:putative membrane protein
MIHPPLAISAAAGVPELGLIALAGLLYARRERTLARAGPCVPRWRRACFYAGLATIAVALTVLDHLAHVSFSWQVAQTLLLGEIASLLIVLGLTAALLAPMLRLAIRERLRVLASPLIAFPLWAINLYLWHLRVLSQAAFEHAGVQVIEHACLLAFGINMWMCLFGPLPMPRWFGNFAKLLYILAVRVAAVVLANILLWSGEAFYPFYTQPDTTRHLSPLVDQNMAGAIMMAVSSLLTLGLLCWLFLRTLREADAQQDVLARTRGAGVELAGARAGRAVAASRVAHYRASAAGHGRQDRELGPFGDGRVGPL